MLPGKSSVRPRMPTAHIRHRLRNRVVRYLCIGLLTTIIIFMVSLIRISQLENRRIASGLVGKKPPPPAPWESFEFIKRYYGGIRTLVSTSENAPEYPRLADEQEYNASAADLIGRDLPPSKPFGEHPSSVLQGDRSGDINECFLDPDNKVRVPPVRYYEGRPRGFPDHVLGAYDVLSLPEDICFERYGRLGPYGLGYSLRTGGLGIGQHGDKEGSENVWDSVPHVDWRNLDWAETQQRCYEANSKRYRPIPATTTPKHGFFIGGRPDTARLEARSQEHSSNEEKASRPDSSASSSSETEAPPQASDGMPRTAFVVRCWDEFEWKEEDRANLRALISEVSLASGGRYDVHLLVQVRNDAKYPIWADEEAYNNRIKESLPEEFQGLATLWSQTQMLAVYQGVHDLFTTGPNNPIHGAYRGLQMAMQHFAYLHPEYDYFWQWEMDIRYTGHYYDLVSKLEGWAKEQPRKGLWGRNARFYVPSVHGSWEDFKHMARVQSEIGVPNADTVWNDIPGAGKDKKPQVNKPEELVWGPARPAEKGDWLDTDNDPHPPTSQERDQYTWGVGEEADLITLNPMFDPEGTTWGLREDITGYNVSEGIDKLPRRAQIITASRMSHRLLATMHRETAFKKHHAFPEMWPATVSLHHGYKAVFAPHPVYVDREWPTDYLARVLNGGRNGAAGGSRVSVFGEREHNMRGLSWFYNAGFGGNLYRRWLGLRGNNDGGEEFELTADMSKNDTTVSLMRGGEGRMCLPPMLLHPVKGMDLPVQSGEEEEEVEVPESDPAA